MEILSISMVLLTFTIKASQCLIEAFFLDTPSDSRQLCWYHSSHRTWELEWCSICNLGKCGLNRNQTTMKVRKTRFILMPKSMDMWFLLHLHFCPIMAQKVTGLKMANFGFKRLFCSSAPRVKNCNLENLKPLVRILWFLFWWFHFSFTEIMLSLMGVLYQMLVEIRWYSNN